MLRYGLLCRALVKAGHKVVWWTSDFNHALKKKRVLTEPIFTAPEGYEVRQIPTVPYYDNIGIRRAWSHICYANAWQRMAEEAVAQGELDTPDIVLTSWPPCETARIARIFRKHWGCRVVVDIMDAWPENFYRLIPGPTWVKELLGPLFFAHLHRLARRAYQLSDAVSGVGLTYLNLAAKYGCKKPRHLCYHGITRMNGGAQRYTQDVNEPLRLIYVGNMGRSYDLLTVIRGVRQLVAAKEPVRLDLAGAGPKESMLRRAAMGCNAINFHGYLSNESMAQLLADSDVAIVPMFPDSFVAVPYKLADYTSAGLPMISCLTGETEMLIKRYGAGTQYLAGSVSSFVDAVRRYLRQRTLVTQESLSSARIARENFMMDTIYTEFVQFLTALK